MRRLKIFSPERTLILILASLLGVMTPQTHAASERRVASTSAPARVTAVSATARPDRDLNPPVRDGARPELSHSLPAEDEPLPEEEIPEDDDLWEDGPQLDQDTDDTDDTPDDSDHETPDDSDHETPDEDSP